MSSQNKTKKSPTKGTSKLEGAHSKKLALLVPQYLVRVTINVLYCSAERQKMCDNFRPYSDTQTYDGEFNRSLSVVLHRQYPHEETKCKYPTVVMIAFIYFPPFLLLIQYHLFSSNLFHLFQSVFCNMKLYFEFLTKFHV